MTGELLAADAAVVASAAGCVATIGMLIQALKPRPAAETWAPPVELQGPDREWLSRQLDLADITLPPQPERPIVTETVRR